MTVKTVNGVQCLYFSPTGSTRKIVEATAGGADAPWLEALADRPGAGGPESLSSIGRSGDTPAP